MDYEELLSVGNDVILRGTRNFGVAEILDCGQCFRWQPVGPDTYRGVALGRSLTISQVGDEVTLHGMDRDEFLLGWQNYFDLDRDYNEVKAVLGRDAIMRRAIGFTPGMRVLRQPPWETLCSFIISANNNIKRIQGIVERLSGLFGRELQDGWDFPTPQRMAVLTEEDLAPVRCGYRARYLLDAARRVAEGRLELSPLYSMPLPEARIQLRQVCGVGTKVAECVLLYGFARAQCVPIDVWIRRALEQLYPDGMPESILPVAGLGQQYLFHYVRSCQDALNLKSGGEMSSI